MERAIIFKAASRYKSVVWGVNWIFGTKYLKTEHFMLKSSSDLAIGIELSRESLETYLKIQL